VIEDVCQLTEPELGGSTTAAGELSQANGGLCFGRHARRLARPSREPVEATEPAALVIVSHRGRRDALVKDHDLGLALAEWHARDARTLELPGRAGAHLAAGWGANYGEPLTALLA